jgi:hypothetical protein
MWLFTKYIELFVNCSFILYMTKPEMNSLMVTTNLSIKMLKLYTKTLDIIFEITGTQLVLNTFELNFIHACIPTYDYLSQNFWNTACYEIKFKRIYQLVVFHWFQILQLVFWCTILTFLFSNLLWPSNYKFRVSSCIKWTNN